MATPKYSIPGEFKDQLRFVDAADTRSDDKILDSLREAAPLGPSEKNTWAFWDSVVNNMPDWTRRNISVPWMYGTTMANHFIAARQHDPFIKRWHDLFVYLWSGKDIYEGHCVVEILYVGDGFSCADYAQKNILWFDALEEDWAAETVVGYQGEKLFEALTTRLHEDPESERYKRAYKTVWRILTNSSMQKVTHGKKLTKTPALGVLLDKPENANKDIEPGTFADLLRYGSVHFEQTRSQITVIQTEKPTETMKKGIFEP
uniref:Uncharacterized protein n=1 Tax=Talaromyces marneffei PM1 TaxID=1077442 RepID=A0A093Y562_TALMA